MIAWSVSVATILASVSLPLAIHIFFWRLGDLRRETETQAEQRSFEAKMQACKELVPSITEAIQTTKLSKRNLTSVLSDKDGKFYDDLSKIIDVYRERILAPFRAIDRMERLLNGGWKSLAFGGSIGAIVAVFSNWYDPSITLMSPSGQPMDVMVMIEGALVLSGLFIGIGFSSVRTYVSLRRSFYRNYELDPKVKAHIEKVHPQSAESRTLS